jgi:hypothetical protein
MTTMRTSLMKHDISLEAFSFYNDLLPSDALYTRCNRMISSKKSAIVCIFVPNSANNYPG